jgi:hypothetical protein
VLALLALLIWLGRKYWGARRELGRFSGIAQLEKHQEELAHSTRLAETGLERTSAELAKLRNELVDVGDAAELQSFGVYHPHYDFEEAEHYAARLKEMREKQKSLIKSDLAVTCSRDWTVDGSRAKGLKMVKEHTKLMLRAFNGDCDAAITKVKYNNILNTEKRIERSFAAVNRLGKTKNMQIAQTYLHAKLAELRLVHEHREKQQEIKEEQRRIREQMREEERAQRELAQATERAEKDEQQYTEKLEKAKQELAQADARAQSKLQALVDSLEQRLKEALDRKAKAISRAQLTRSGHVYVLSNIGSFGEQVYKIGMTRRLEPLDRVKELGDASVPFKFDVHAMIYCEDAPRLENALHKYFADRRVNKVNLRREYFRVTLDEIRQAVAKQHGIVTFRTVPEAEEYRKTVAIEAEADEQHLAEAG